MSYLVREALAAWRDCRTDFELYREHAFDAAHEATHGVLLNQRGLKAGVDPWSLFIGNDVRARAYASRELTDWWEDHPRLTFERFEQQWSEDRDR
jgi:hypothetical protein